MSSFTCRRKYVAAFHETKKTEAHTYNKHTITPRKISLPSPLGRVKPFATEGVLNKCRNKQVPLFLRLLTMVNSMFIFIEVISSHLYNRD